MGQARVGALGVADATGDLYVVDSTGNITRLKRGTEEQVLIVRVGALNDLGETVDLEWADINKLARAFLSGDATDPVFKAINYDDGFGVIANPVAVSEGTHAVLRYDVSPAGTLTRRAIPWQRVMPEAYSGDDLTLTIYCALDAAPAAGTDVVWEAAFQRLNAGANLNDDTTWGAFKAAAAVDVATPGVGIVVAATIPFTQAEAAAIAAGDPFRIAIRRNGFDAGSDTLDGNVNLLRWELTEDA